MHEPIESRPAHRGLLTHRLHRQPRPHLYFFFDLLVEAPPPLSARSRRSSSTCCKALFKKSISIACRPTFRSSSAIRLSSARFTPAPRKACAPCSSSSLRQRCRSVALTSNARATSPADWPDCNRRIAFSLNSLVNVLRDIIPVSPFDHFCGLTGCLKNRVHSIDSRQRVVVDPSVEVCEGFS